MLYTKKDNNYICRPKDNPKDLVEVEIGDTKQVNFYPQVKIKRWDNEVNFSARLITENVKLGKFGKTGENISYQEGKHEVNFYELPADTTEKHTDINYIKLGTLSPAEMSASYDLFKLTPTKSLSILTYLPESEMYWMMGRYNALSNIKVIDRPISRYRPVDTSFPSMFVDKNTVIVDMFYPAGAEIPDTLGIFTEILREYGYNGKVNEPTDGRIYFETDNGPKKFLSWGTDGEHYIFYISLVAPTYDFRSNYTNGIGGEYEYGGLSEIIKCDESIIDEFVKKLGEQLSMSVTDYSLDINESTIYSGLTSEYDNTDWSKNAITNVYTPEKRTEDEYEFDVILNEKPTTNIVSMSLQTKGLEFSYQPALMSEELLAGNYRPDRVVESYAVYYKDCPANIDGGKEYKTGKAFHIYRPRITDSSGKSVWGKLNIDIENNLLNVEIPQDFLDTAQYPIKNAAGLNFGYTTAGASINTITETSSNDDPAGKVATGAVGTADSITAYLGSISSSARTYKYGLYQAGNYIATTTANTDFLSTRWTTINLTTNPTLSAIDYQILVAASGSSSVDGNTKINTPKGFIKIKNIKVGDIVYSNIKDELVENKVINILYGEHDSYYVINNTLKISKNHPIKTRYGYIEPSKLEVGYDIYTTKGYVKIDSLEVINKKVEFFNLQLENEPHNFYANGYLLHNASASGKTIYYDTGSSGDGVGYRYGTNGTLLYANMWPSTLSLTTNTRKYSIYVTYTAGGGGGTGMQINISDVWKVVSGVQINIGDVWKPVTKAQINIGDVWKSIF